MKKLTERHEQVESVSRDGGWVTIRTAEANIIRKCSEAIVVIRKNGEKSVIPAVMITIHDKLVSHDPE